MVRRMNYTLQERMLQQMMSNTRWGNEVDIHSHMDRSLRLDENMRNIQQMHGIQKRNFGLEHLEQRRQEQHREHIRRQDTTRQTGPIQGMIGHHLDAMLHALLPGRRVSGSGRVYYERRENRSDRNYNQRL